MKKTWIKVAPLSRVPPEGTLLVDFGDRPVCLYRLGDAIYATQDDCTHSQASLADGLVFGEEIECPLHQGRFHIPTGKAVKPPCTRDLRVYRVKVKGGAVWLQE